MTAPELGPFDHFQSALGGGPEETDDFAHLGGRLRRQISAGPYRDHLEYLIQLDGAYGIFSHGMCLGIVAGQPMGSGRSWQLWECLVHAAHRRQGLGTRLLNRLARELKGREVETLACFLPAHHEPGLKFLQARGFQLAGFDRDREKMVYLRKDL